MSSWQLKGVLGFLPRRRVPQVLQSEAAECGVACLAMVAGFHGLHVDLPALRQRWSLSLKGAGLALLMQMAQSLNFAPRAVRASLDELSQLSLPCILHWNLDHFVVLEAVRTNRLILHDPAIGRRQVSMALAGRAFTGVALELLPLPEFRRQRLARRLKFRDISSSLQHAVPALLSIFAVSLALQCLVLLLPFYSQLVIDEVVVSHDLAFLHLLALAAVLLVIVQALMGMLRGWTVLTLATRINLHWTTGVFHHLLRLPLDYFEKRHLGDIQSRFGSLGALQQLVSQQFVEAIVDGLMALTTLAVMLFYSPALTAAVATSVFLCIGVRLLFFPAARRAAQESLVLTAQKDSFFLETIRGLLTIKCFRKEAQRELRFHNRVVEAWNGGVRVNRLTLWQNGITQCVFGLQLVAVIWLGAKAVISGELTVGMLVAFLSYRSLFTERTATLIDRLLQFRLARVQLERLGDILHTPVEPAFSNELTTATRSVRPLAVRVSGVSFRYADGEPRVLRDVELRVAAGEHVVLTGPSGCGKSTLIKIMMGLLEADDGAVRIDNRRLQHYGLLRYRNECASVLQDDRLFSGSLLENISFFDPVVDIANVRAAAKIADIDDCIQAMPMQYLTQVGDMGTVLSGGQRQRVLLARALYGRPRLLFLDEFTSQLDAAAERRICARLCELPVTLVVAAHRAETIRHADREIRLAGAVADQPA